MASDGSSDGGDVHTEPSASSIPNLKALLKESLTEILQETPSLLHPPSETPIGEPSLSSLVGCDWLGDVFPFLQSE